MKVAKKEINKERRNKKNTRNVFFLKKNQAFGLTWVHVSVDEDPEVPSTALKSPGVTQNTGKSKQARRPIAFQGYSQPSRLADTADLFVDIHWQIKKINKLMAHFRLQQMAFYLGGGWPPPHGQIIGCRVEISLDPHEKKPVQ